MPIGIIPSHLDWHDRAILIEAAHFYAEHVVVHSVIAILTDAYRYGHHLEHVLRHDAFVLTILADVSEGVERQIVCGGSHLPDIGFKTNIRFVIGPSSPILLSNLASLGWVPCGLLRHRLYLAVGQSPPCLPETFATWLNPSNSFGSRSMSG